MIVPIKRNDNQIAAFHADEQTVFEYQLMGEHKITAQFQATDTLPIQIGDYIEHQGERFYINKIPACARISSHVFEYHIDFEAEIYRLHDKIFMHEGDADFSYFGDAGNFIDLIVANINEIESGWSKGVVDSTEEVNIHFTNVSCRKALDQIGKEFKLEYYLERKKINLVKLVGNNTSLEFQYGKEKGLFKLSRELIEDKNIVTRIYGFGAAKNLPSTYRGGSKKLKFEKDGQNYLEKNTALYGIKEGSVNFEDIFPNRTGVVSSTSDKFHITDNNLDFDINDYLLEGVVAKIVFKTGDLGGNEFEIVSYDKAKKEIYFKVNIESNDVEIPNDTFKPAVGDHYTLVDIKMPQSYIDSAEVDLKNKTQSYLDENSVPRVIYALEIDRFYAEEHNLSIHVGDRLQIKDDKLGVNETIRTSAISYPIVYPYAIRATIANTIPYTVQERLKADTVSNKKIIKDVDRARSEASRRNTMRTRQLQDLVFDPDGYFDSENIKPESIETLMLSVGAKSQDFYLSGVRISANYQGDKNQLHISSGHLIHNEVEIEGLGYNWSMSSNNFGSLDSGKAYYVYAKCSQTALTGTWDISETPLKTDAIAGYWIFNLGVLYAAFEDRRDFAFTNGMTFTNGGTITTGTIKDSSGKNKFDLDNGVVRAVNPTEDSGIDVNGLRDGLTILGAVVQNPGGETSSLGVDRGNYNSAAIYYPGDTVFASGSTYRWIYLSPGNEHPPNATYWSLLASQGEKGDKGDAGAKGPQGEQGIQGPSGSDGETSYFHVKYSKNASGNPMTEIPDTYIGTYVDFNSDDSSDYKDYTWSRFEGLQGEKGTQGIPGKNGDDGKTSYLHIKYSDDGGNSFTGNSGEKVGDWIGTYVDFNSDDSTVVGDYTWAKIKGAKGDKGAKGTNGDDGNWVELRFAKNGSNSSAPSLNKSTKNPAGWQTNPPSVGDLEYLWMTKSEKAMDGSLITNWSDPVRIKGEKGDKGNKGDKGEKGAKGDKGAKGNVGPSLVFRKNYDSEETYSGDSTHVEAVEYNNHYYVTRVDAGSFSNKVPTDTDYWNDFGAEFESVATGLLLAKMSYIENLVVGLLSTNTFSQDRDNDAPSNEPYLSAAGAEIDFWDAGTKPSQETNKGKALLRLGKGVGYMQVIGQSNKPGISTSDAGNIHSELSSAGIFSNASRIDVGTGGQSINVTIAGLLKERNNGLYGISAAIYGEDQTDNNDGSSESWGGYFNTLKASKKSSIAGLILKTKVISENDPPNQNTPLSEDVVFVSYYPHGGNGTYRRVYLPANPEKGKTVFLKSVNDSFRVYPAGSEKVITKSGSGDDYGVLRKGNGWAFVFDGSYWCAVSYY